jgi:3-phenylpropionate/trans-cinnamate dioxygenase ferredoxin component
MKIVVIGGSGRIGTIVMCKEEGREMPTFVTVATTDELGLGGAKQVQVDGKTLALFNLAGTYYAIDDTCPHRGGSLSQGAIEGEQVTCPRHGAVFRITTGEVLRPPAQTAVAGYTVRVSGKNVEVEI